ncbi:MAG: DUF4956 domain-containing protein [Oscillospiraceae bacterium]|jgi:uncharacterized membrane protein YhiD involved in acid resistance|nr:DUF4956 domain-containing protein [Oscillospiraceae bacterium]
MPIQPLAISDFFKTKVLEQFTASLTAGDMLLSLAASFVIGLVILLVYRLTFKGVIFSKNFAFSLVLLGMITALVIRTISSNLALSLGMVGALSIVRFRTAIKDPTDTVFMFWAIANGIITGAGLYFIAGIATVTMGVLYILIGYLMQKRSEPYLLVLRYDAEYEKNITWVLRRLQKYRIKSKTVSGTSVELALEITLTERANEIVNQANTLEGIQHVSLVSYESEFGL